MSFPESVIVHDSVSLTITDEFMDAAYFWPYPETKLSY